LRESLLVNARRSLSHAIAEGDGISYVANIEDVDSAQTAASAGAEALLVHSGLEGRLMDIRGAAHLPILFFWDGEKVDRLAGADACIVDIGMGQMVEDAVDFGELEVAWRVTDEEQLEDALTRFDPELFVLAGTLDQVLELLAEVPAGKLAIAELALTTEDEVQELERAGVDAVIVHAEDVSPLVGDAPPEV